MVVSTNIKKKINIQISTVVIVPLFLKFVSLLILLANLAFNLCTIIWNTLNKGPLLRAKINKINHRCIDLSPGTADFRPRRMDVGAILAAD